VEVVEMKRSSDADLIDQAPVQDRDLLQRMSLYFDAIDHRLEQGQGWFIFNAPSNRARRIASFIETRSSEHTPPLSTCFVPWRDFSVSAYVTEVGLSQLEAEVAQRESERMAHELALARQVTASTEMQMLHSDLVVLTGLKPQSWHEATYLDRLVDARYNRKQATILVTPDMPGRLEDEFRQLDPSSTFWERLFDRMYETSLVAL
jgi:hypothetical protein